MSSLIIVLLSFVKLSASYVGVNVNSFLNFFEFLYWSLFEFGRNLTPIMYLTMSTVSLHIMD
jgi:hypothetical protein